MLHVVHDNIALYSPDSKADIIARLFSFLILVQKSYLVGFGDTTWTLYAAMMAADKSNSRYSNSYLCSSASCGLERWNRVQRGGRCRGRRKCSSCHLKLITPDTNRPGQRLPAEQNQDENMMERPITCEQWVLSTHLRAASPFSSPN